MDVSVVIVSWNTETVLKDCLCSIYRERGEIANEIIVVDNASSDNTANMVAREFPEVKLVRNKVNRGFAAANNQGIKIATGRYILLLNPDTILLDNAIAKTISFADKHSEAGIVGCRMLNSDGSLQRDCFLYHSILNLVISTFGLHTLFPKSRFFGRERMTWWDFKTVRQVEVVAGCFMLVRRKAIDQVGLMDETYFMYTEETDWCWRMNSCGWNVLYYPQAEIIHLGGMSTRQSHDEMQLEAKQSMLRFIEKRQGRLARWLAECLLFVGALLRMCYRACSLPFIAQGKADKT